MKTIIFWCGHLRINYWRCPKPRPPAGNSSSNWAVQITPNIKVPPLWCIYEELNGTWHSLIGSIEFSLKCSTKSFLYFCILLGIKCCFFRCQIYSTKIYSHLQFEFWYINWHNGLKTYIPPDVFYFSLYLLIL